MPHLSTTGNVINERNRIVLAETIEERKRKADCLYNASFTWPSSCSQNKCNPNSSSNSSSDPVVINENQEFDQRQVEVILHTLHQKVP